MTLIWCSLGAFIGCCVGILCAMIYRYKCDPWDHLKW
jgi:hypothetical protein